MSVEAKSLLDLSIPRQDRSCKNEHNQNDTMGFSPGAINVKEATNSAVSSCVKSLRTQALNWRGGSLSGSLRQARPSSETPGLVRCHLPSEHATVWHQTSYEASGHDLSFPGLREIIIMGR